MSGMKDAASGMTTAAADTIEKAKDIVTRSTKVYEGASEANTLPKAWITRARSPEKLAELAQRQPWVAVAGAFVIGYVAAQTLRRLSS